MKKRFSGTLVGVKFYILSGVRRALATRESGRKTIRAVVYREGHAPVRRRVRLSRLYSPKAEVKDDDRFWVIQPPILVSIDVEPLGTRAQTASVPLSRVRLV